MSLPTASNCSDIRDINEAKVANILSYLDSSSHQPPHYYGISGVEGSLSQELEETGRHATPHVLSFNNPHNHNNSNASLPLSAVHMPQPSLLASAPSSSGALPSSFVHNNSSDPYALMDSQQTYRGIKAKIEKLQFDKEVLQQENNDLRGQLKNWVSREEERKAEYRDTFHAELAELKLEGKKYKKAEKELQALLRQERESMQKTIDALTTELRHQKQKFEEEQEKMERASATAMTRLKQNWMAREKAAREKWKIAEAKKIKETTLQSLEPDIVLLLNRHRAEKARLKEEYELALKQRDEIILQKDNSVEALKASLQREAATVLEREKAHYEEQLKEETQRVRSTLEDERRHHKTKLEQLEYHFTQERRTLQQELDRVGEETLRLRQSLTTDQAGYQETLSREVAKVTAASQEKLEEVRAQLTREMQQREKENEATQAKWLAEKELELRKKCEVERDLAIQKVIQKLEEEHLRSLTLTQNNDDVLRERYSQLTRDKERLQVELHLVREQLQQAQALEKERKKEYEALKEAAVYTQEREAAVEARVQAERQHEETLQQQAWQQKLAAQQSTHVKEVYSLQEQLQTLKEELTQAQQQKETQLRQLDQQHYAVLTEINEKMLVTLTQRDTTMHTLKERITGLEEAIRVRDRELERHGSLLKMIE